MQNNLNLTNVTSDLWFSVSANGDREQIIIPQELLDDELNDTATIEQRKAWVEANIEAIMQAYEAKKVGGPIRPPFNRIIVRGEI